METIEVRDDADNRYYELRVNGEQAGLMVYEPQGSRLVLTHTFIHEPFRGRGLANALVRGSLDDIRARGLTVTNYCAVVDEFIHRHPEYEAVIDQAHPGSGNRHTAERTHDGGESDAR